MTETPSVSPGIEAQWPTLVGGQTIPYASLAGAVQDRLLKAGLPLESFSHFAVVVADIQETLRTLAERAGAEWKTAEVVWGKAFGCHIACRLQNRVELEVIQPVSPSFLLDSLRERGEGLHHLCFDVQDLEKSVRILKTQGEQLADDRIYNGLHGRICFVKPGRICPLHIELCEAHQRSTHA